MENTGKTEGRVQVCLSEGRAELVEKKSRFLSLAVPVQREEEVQALLQRVRREHRDARHHCYAYILGAAGETEKFSDDGEPAKTAGMPILELLRIRRIRGCCVVVTRYFGGILLGTGGLVRAYRAAAAAALAQSVIGERSAGKRVLWEADYSLYGSLQHMAEEEKLPVLRTEFGALVTMEMLIPDEKWEQVQKKTSEMSNGRLKTGDPALCFYCMAGGKLHLLPEAVVP